MTQKTIPPVTSDQFKVALLENNQAIFDRMDKAIAASAVSITKAVNDKTDGFVGTLTSQATQIGANTTKIQQLEDKYSNIWIKVGTLIGGVSLVVGIVGYFVGAGHFIAK